MIATTLATIGGFTPLILFGGRFWPPMATAIAGGVVGCSILALYYVPALFRGIRRRSPGALSPAGREPLVRAPARAREIPLAPMRASRRADAPALPLA